MVDSDHDGLSDEEEATYGTDPFKADTDSDGLTDGDEVIYFNTDPTNPDTDGDRISDGQEVRVGTDPKDPNSFPSCGDGVVNDPGEECDGSDGVTAGHTCDCNCRLVADPSPTPTPTPPEAIEAMLIIRPHLFLAISLAAR